MYKIGIDLGVKEFAVDDKNHVYENPKYLANSLKKLQEEYRKLSRMQKGSSNFRKQSNFLGCFLDIERKKE